MSEGRAARARFVVELATLRRQSNLSANDISTWISHRYRRSVPPATISDWFKPDPRIPRGDEKFVLVLECLHTAASLPWPGTTQAHWKKLRAAAYADPRPPTPADQYESRPEPTTSTPMSRLMVVGRIPRRAPFFVDRAQVWELQEMLRRSAVAAVVTGMRGAGKTQVAAAYAREVIAASESGLVGWVNAETADTLLAGLGEVAARMGVADPEGDSAKSAHRLRDHLSERREPALLVLDNATDPDLVDTLLPTGGMTRVVVTSTDRAFTQFGEFVDAGLGFARAESVQYLGEATELDDPDGADQVAADLGDLPLALSAAAATITGRRLNYLRYRQLLAAQPLPAVLPRRRGSDHPLAVDQALLLAVQTVETPTDDPELDMAVRWLLGVMAMLAPDGVIHTMLPDDDGRLGAALQRCVEGSLLSWSVNGDVVVMHRLLSRVIRERADTTETLGQLAADAAAVITPLLFDESEAFRRREEGSRLVDHIEALWKAVNHISDFDALTTSLAARRWATQQLIESAELARAINLARRTVAAHEQILGNHHPDTLTARHSLAYAYHWAERLQEATTLHEQVLASRVWVLGDDHPDTLTARHNLANTYESAGRLTEAITLYELTLADRERILDPDHPDTLYSRNNLANAYRSAGRLSEAIALYERNLADRERVLGPDQLDTLTARHNLANAYKSTGRLTEAITLHEQVLADRERVLGPDHPHAQYSRGNLAHAYISAGRVSEAIALCERNLADREHLLDPDHPDTLRSRDHLATAYRAGGRLSEAITLHGQVLADRERVLGLDHPDTLISRNNLALTYTSAGRLSDAITAYELNHTNSERVLGSDHPETLTARHNLANAYRSAGRLSEAIALYERNLADRERVLGDDHPYTLTTRHYLASAYESAGRVAEAIALYEQNLTAAEQALDSDHPHISIYRGHLSRLREETTP
ncbi:tetratricopeptide repeat protein [Nocardia anaemiae]|uniref:tetratricopeptide repeat protein n=1 Tax=Nocardia anaemiae TaxID=263910 RepID=UPI0012F5157C|nr:tetratricopeptide repeat protein [Nocardia anaemiae]